MSLPSTSTIALSRLRRNVPALTEPLGGSLIEACMICFEDQGHASGVALAVTGDYNTTFIVKWEGEVTQDMLRAWENEEVATENAAYGIAILLIEELTGYTAIARADKGTGIDFWLGYRTTEPNKPFQRMARLEISGIRHGNVRRIEARVKQKKRQTNLSASELPAYVVVVEFSVPTARVVKK